MSSPFASKAAPFGRMLTAMVTPFSADHKLDLDAARDVATYLVDNGNDGLVVSGTTGESPTTTTDEDAELLHAVIEAVGDRATVVAGVGTNDTAHSIELARQAAAAGADGLLVVTPYYSKPPQSAIVAHIEQIARAGQNTPIMLYDIPSRTGTQLAEDTITKLHANTPVVALKDAVGDIERGTWLMKQTGIALYSGDDPLNLAWLAVGACGVVSVVGHVAGRQYADMIAAVANADLATARSINVALLAVVREMMTTTQGAMTAKAALEILGITANRSVRAPLIESTDVEVSRLRAVLEAANLLG